MTVLIGSWQRLRGWSVTVSINGKPLASVTSNHYLGVLIDQHLTWKLHVNNVLKRVSYILYHLKPLPGHLLFWLYQAFVLPIFDYCDVVWAPTLVTFSKPLERLHSRFLQHVPVCNPFVKVTLSECCRFYIAIQVCIKDIWFVFTETYTRHSGQNKFRLFVPQIHTSLNRH